jgi:hypothetical protein
MALGEMQAFLSNGNVVHLFHANLQAGVLDTEVCR